MDIDQTWQAWAWDDLEVIFGVDPVPVVDVGSFFHFPLYWEIQFFMIYRYCHSPGDDIAAAFLDMVFYYRATRMHSADYAVAKCLSICLSVTRLYCV